MLIQQKLRGCISENFSLLIREQRKLTKFGIRGLSLTYLQFLVSKSAKITFLIAYNIRAFKIRCVLSEPIYRQIRGPPVLFSRIKKTIFFLHFDEFLFSPFFHIRIAHYFSRM